MRNCHRLEIPVVYPPVELVIATDCILQFVFSYTVSVKLWDFVFQKVLDYQTKGVKNIYIGTEY